MDEEIIRITKDLPRAKELQTMAQERMKDIIPILPKDKPYKIIEEYYEVIIQIITAIMYAEGYKTLSHVALITYVSRSYKELNQDQIQLIDKLRRFRHGTVYYGKKVSEGFLANHETEIRKIILVLEHALKDILGKTAKA